MKKIVTLSAIAFLSTAAFAVDADVQKQIDELNQKIEQLQKTNSSQDKKISEVNAQSAQNNIKFNVDFRTSYDNLRYKTASGETFSNDALYASRLWLGMGYAPTEDMLFKGQLAYNKAFGASYGQRGTGFGFDTFDWVINENLTDDTLRVREAYWLWNLRTGSIGWTASVGRRPSTNGFLSNLREDDAKAKSPMGHVINMEFDGASVAMKLDSYVPGMYAKLCLGRGLTNATGWAAQAASYLGVPPSMGGSNQPTNYTKDGSNLDNVDMAGFIFVPYDNGQYSVETTWYRGFNVPGLVATNITVDAMGNQIPTAYAMKNTGNMDGAAISFKADGIGEGISDFLDETTLFASAAMSKSHPNIDNTRAINMSAMGMGTMNMTGSSMLGSNESETGTSIWIGAVMPNLTGGKFGLEYNHGSKYWRPFTYGEDTMIGSKMAVRGNAYEAYWSQPIIKDVFSMQVRYTYLDYKYTGSNGFFGDEGTPMSMSEAKAMGMDPVETAQDIRVYFRYRY
ncbi:MAG: DUF3373 family protein [Sulfurimonas sp.]|uniref:DUF3373 family protein n=1 Tax=Sulfurimonas sp. TaxID=2022749 RepID=UPI00262A5FAB|nr:DUF3373 family protein [Sulfurimonas sp.]MDD5400483.1 DUF3373 family protein [Sulfurimonas sp.]